jgi:shikimate O-hydroxycinnamoyltransferase
MNSIPLTPIDHIFTGVGSYPIEFVFAYDGTIDPERLLISLHEAVQYFVPVSSELAVVAENTYALQASDAGIHFEVGESPATFGDPDARYSFLDPVNSVPREPLTRIKLSQTPEGSVLGVSMSHAVGDGFSYFYFLSSWARLFHGGVVVEPFNGRELLIPESSQASTDHTTPADVLSDSGIFWDERRRAIARDRIHWDRFHLSKEEQSELLAEAGPDAEARLSFNDVISAHLWRTYIPRWDSDDGEGTTYVSCPVDVRRIIKGFPRTYFGNAVGLATRSLERRDLADAPLGRLASIIRSAVASVDETYMRNALSTLEAMRLQKGLRVLEENHVIHPRSGILITNLSRLPVQEIEFDAGPPVAFDILTPAVRGAVVLPAEDGVDIRVCYPFADD